MSLRRTILIACIAALVGGLTGTWIARARMGRDARRARAAQVYATLLFLNDQIEATSGIEAAKAKTGLDHQLALYALEAESLAQREDDPGFLARKALKLVAAHRATPAYLEEERAVKLMLDKPIDPLTTR